MCVCSGADGRLKTETTTSTRNLTRMISVRNMCQEERHGFEGKNIY